MSLFSKQVCFTKEADTKAWKHVDVKSRTLNYTYIDGLEPNATYQFCIKALLDENVSFVVGVFLEKNLFE